MAEARKNSAEWLRKITVKHVLGHKVEELMDEIVKKKTLPLMNVYGRVDKAKPDSSPLGPFVKFFGEFYAINRLNGANFASGSCILPPLVQDTIYGAMGTLDERGNAQHVVEFALEIGVKHEKTAATKYVYYAQPLIETRPSNPMADLLARAGVKDVKQIEAK